MRWVTEEYYNRNMVFFINTSLEVGGHIALGLNFSMILVWL